MYVNVSMMDHGKLSFEFDFEQNEPGIQKSEMIGQSCYVQGPEDWLLSQIHPDHLALSSLLIVRPWFNKSLRFSFQQDIGVLKNVDICLLLFTRGHSPIYI